MWLDTIKLGFGHNLVAGKVPSTVDLQKFNEAFEKSHQQSLESYGLFDTASPNFSHYYPDVNAEDLIPKDSDFINPVFRALSEVVVHKNWNPVDFSRNGVLKKSTSLLVGQTIYANHEASIGNELGSISEALWQAAYKMGDIEIPAGINTKLLIDGKSNPKIARGIMMDPPSIHSTSVTVQFAWDKSHPSLTEEDFFRKLGTYDENGKLISKIATQIKRYTELSLVSHGADPFAQKQGKDGKIVNPVFANNTYKLSAEDKKNQLYFFYNYKDELIQNTEITIPEIPIKNTLKENNPIMLKEIALALGITLQEGEDKNSENQTALLGAIQGLKDNQVDQTELAALKKAKVDLATLTESSKDLVNLTEFKKTTTEALRAKVTELVNLVTNNAPNTLTTTLIKDADIKVLAALEVQYLAQVEEKMPLSCNTCGSHEVGRGSSKPEIVVNEDGKVDLDKMEAGEAKLKEFIKSKTQTNYTNRSK